MLCGIAGISGACGWRSRPSAFAFSCCARFAGLPETPLPRLPFFFDCLACCRRPPPPMPGIPGIDGIPGIPGIAPPAMRSIILRASTNRFTRLFTSDTSTPAPLAIRARREPLSTETSSRSCGVMEQMIASIRSISRSSISLIASLNCPAPGSMPRIFDSGPILRS